MLNRILHSRFRGSVSALSMCSIFGLPWLLFLEELWPSSLFLYIWTINRQSSRPTIVFFLHICMCTYRKLKKKNWMKKKTPQWSDYLLLKPNFFWFHHSIIELFTNPADCETIEHETVNTLYTQMNRMILHVVIIHYNFTMYIYSKYTDKYVNC